MIAETPLCAAQHVDAAVEAAAAAFPAWWETPATERARVLFRFKALLEENFEELVRCNTREHGKTLVESRGDVKRGIEMVEFACGVPSLLMGEALENIARGIDCESHPPAPRRVCRHHSVQLPGHGAAMDVSRSPLPAAIRSC